MEKLEAIVDDIVFQSDDGMFSVLRMESKAQGRFTAVYHGNAPYMGENVAMEGNWIEHARFGRQFDIQALQVLQPTSVAGIERFLASGAVKGVGPVTAARIVEAFGTDTLEILGSYPERLAQVRGISAKKAAAIGESYSQLSGLRELMVFLEAHGVSSGYAARLQATYGATAITRIKENPYSLAEDITGIGFKTADRIAMAMGMEHDCEERLRAGIAYALTQAAGVGHTCVPEELLVRETARALAVDTSMVQDVFSSLLEQDLLRTEEMGGIRLIYPEYLYTAEVQTARRLLKLRDQAKPVTRVNADEVIAKWERDAGITLAEAQRQAIYASLEHGVFVLTGGPGTGKTTTINAIIRYFEGEGAEIRLAAPTGRAAKRMTEATGYEAQTIHRLLELSGMPEDDREGQPIHFERNAENPLETDVIIIDEMSMVDIHLIHSLLMAVTAGTRLILVGDENQLPSVGPGNVLRDIIRSGQFPVVELKKIFRQASESDIVVNAHKINKGEQVEINNKSRDFFFLKRYDADIIIRVVIALIQEKLPKYVEAKPFEIQVLTPMRKGLLGVERLNQILQRYLNPPDASKKEKEIGQGLFREGDKVMQVRNNYQLEWEIRGRYGIPIEKGVGVFNGDTGIIKTINEFAETAEVEFEDGRWAEYSFKQLDELELAYAVTIHKSQGSEYPAVIIPLLSGPRMLMNRNLLYTAVTRARKCVTVVGSEETFRDMIRNEKQQRRYSSLDQRIQETE